MTKTSRKTGDAKAGPKHARAAKPAPAAKPKGKLETLTALLRRKSGATLEQMTEATGWQSHSVRGAMAGTLKKKQGLDVTSEKVDGVRTYRIVETPAE